ncbi:MAG: hypothetical protein JXR96_11560 [Deltaproteobacteria bacterium]|nr:hypothetical protein [Deltaproteobacteria bacterium]
MKCEHCGYEQPGGKFCDNCGRMLTRILVEEEPAEEAPVAAALVSIRCHRCGHEQAGGRICEACGIMLEVYREMTDEEEEETSRRCPSCGLPSSRPVCINCGVRIPDFSEEE